jgi:hypothetical protein
MVRRETRENQIFSQRKTKRIFEVESNSQSPKESLSVRH